MHADRSRPHAAARMIGMLLALLCAACSPVHSQTEPAPTPPPVQASEPAPGPRVQPGGGDQVPDLRSAQALPDRSCRSDADCQVKNVGSCCGYYPSCVNKDAQVDPQAVQDACAKSGRMGICGFRTVSACSCQQGQCANAGTPLGGTAQPVTR